MTVGEVKKNLVEQRGEYQKQMVAVMQARGGMEVARRSLEDAEKRAEYLRGRVEVLESLLEAMEQDNANAAAAKRDGAAPQAQAAPQAAPQA